MRDGSLSNVFLKRDLKMTVSLKEQFIQGGTTDCISPSYKSMLTFVVLVSNSPKFLDTIRGCVLVKTENKASSCQSRTYLSKLITYKELFDTIYFHTWLKRWPLIESYLLSMIHSINANVNTVGPPLLTCQCHPSLLYRQGVSVKKVPPIMTGMSL